MAIELIDKIKQKNKGTFKLVDSEDVAFENISVKEAIDDTRKQLSKKANESDLAVERARIDGIVALPDGSTTADAELIDIRVGINGETYPSAGEAVRQQLGEVYEKIDDSAIIETVDTGNTLFSPNPYQGLHSTDYIDLSKFESLTIKVCAYTWNNDAIVFYKKTEDSYTSVAKVKGNSSLDVPSFTEKSYTSRQLKELGATHMVCQTLENSYFTSVKPYDNSSIIYTIKRDITGDIDLLKQNVGQLDEKISKCSDKVSLLEPEVKKTSTKCTALEETTEELKTRVERLESKEDGENVETTPKDTSRLDIHDTVYGYLGDTLQIYKTSIVDSFNPKMLLAEKRGARVFPRYIEIATLVDGDNLIDISLLNNDITTADKKKVIIKAKTPTNPTTTKNILFVGDSRTESGYITEEVSRLLVGTPGTATTPQSMNLSNYKLVGRRGSEEVGYEATGGWSWNTYVKSAPKSLRMYVTGVGSLTIGTVYNYYDSKGRRARLVLEEINLEGGKGNLRFTWSYASPTTELPNPSGSLTKMISDDSGDKTINYTSFVEEKFSPFIKDDEVDFRDYVNNYCNGQVDAICIFLGINDLIGRDANYDLELNIVSHAETFIRKFQEQFPEAKVILGGEVLPSQSGGVPNAMADANFGNTTEGLSYLVRKLNTKYKELAQNLGGNVYYLDINAQFDSEYAYSKGNRQVNTRNLAKESIGNNNVHCEFSGYWQIADAFVRAIINLI